MKKPAPAWVRVMGYVRIGAYAFGRWYGRCLGFLETSPLFPRHHSNDDFIEPPADR